MKYRHVVASPVSPWLFLQRSTPSIMPAYYVPALRTKPAESHALRFVNPFSNWQTVFLHDPKSCLKFFDNVVVKR